MRYLIALLVIFALSISFAPNANAAFKRDACTNIAGYQYPGQYKPMWWTANPYDCFKTFNNATFTATRR